MPKCRLKIGMFRNNKSVALYAIKKGYNIGSISEKLLNDKQFALELVKINGSNILHVPKHLITMDIVLAALETYDDTLRFASHELCDNYELGLYAVQKHEKSLSYLSSRLRANRNIVLAAVSSNGLALRHAKYVMRNDKEVAMAAILNCAKAIKHVSFNLRNNYDLGLATVSANGLYLTHLSAELCGNHDIIQAAIKNNPYSIRYISKQVVSQYYKLLPISLIPKEYITHDLILEKLENCINKLAYVPPHFFKEAIFIRRLLNLSNPAYKEIYDKAWIVMSIFSDGIADDLLPLLEYN